ncbi:MAG: hypothetical protein WDA09_05015 [Bacteriovoracaceae bacterium]
MRFIILILLLGISHAFALRQLTPQAFSSRVTPALNSIQSDFFHILNQFPGFPRELPPLINSLYAHQEIKNHLPLECPRLLNSQCVKEVNTLKAYLFDLNTKLDSIIAKLKPNQTNYLNPLMGIKHLTSSSSQLWALKTELDFASFLIDAQLPTTLNSLDVIHRLDLIRTELILAMLQFIPHLYQTEFKTFYFEFIHPLRLNKNHDYLVKNVLRLNFNLNLFVQSLTKRNKKTPEGSNQYLQLMHMRWNGILRFYK